jgi:hypothetical protein
MIDGVYYINPSMDTGRTLVWVADNRVLRKCT